MAIADVGDRRGWGLDGFDGGGMGRDEQVDGMGGVIACEFG